jgi:integrase
VTKTKEPLTVHLNRYSKAILKRYEDFDDPIPLISDQKSNLYIKEICKAVGFSDEIEVISWKGGKRFSEVYPKYELITNHVARKTFATLSLEKGMPIETVMKIGGWKSYKSFQRYVDVNDTRQKIGMAVWDRKKKPKK